MLYNLSRVGSVKMNKKGFTLVELLAVIAILALLVIIALPNVLKMFNQAKKDTFLTEAKTIYKEISKKYISEAMKGNKISNISNGNNKLELESNDLKYKVKLNNDGSIKKFEVSNGNYCISGKFNNLSDLTTDKIIEGKCEETSPKNFSTDDWETIIDAIREENDGVYNVGDTKEIDLGSYGKHTLRIANKSTPSECSNTNFSQSACGFVLEFVDIITLHKMNDTAINVGGWPATSMRTFVNNDIYNAIPDEIKKVIIDTTTMSGHGSTTKETNFISTDKLYFLSGKEIYSDFNSEYDTAKTLTRQLDYYANNGITTSNSAGTIKKYQTTAKCWWLRTASSTTNFSFHVMLNIGGWNYAASGDNNCGVSPAFRIG